MANGRMRFSASCQGSALPLDIQFSTIVMLVGVASSVKVLTMNRWPSGQTS
jgi:hypothetical protein